MLSQIVHNIYPTMITLWSWWWEADNERDERARTLLSVSILLLTLIWYKWTVPYIKKGSVKTLPPGPWGLPVLGYLPFLSPNLHERFTEMAHKYGDIFSLRLGSKLFVVVNTMDLVKVVTRDLDQTFANRSPPLTALTISYDKSDIVWSDNNAHWRNMRKLLVSQVLSNANLKANQTFRTNEVRKTVKEVYSKIGKKIDINEIAFNTEVNVVTSMLWGYSKSGESNDCSDILDGFREVQFKIVELLAAPNISDFVPMLSWLDIQGREREMRKQREHIDRIFDNIIARRSDTESKNTDGEVEEDVRKDFLQILLELKDREDDAPTSLNIDKIKALLIDIVIAATDTTSTMVEWVMAEILRNPGVMKKVQDELTTVIGMNHIVEEFHLHKLEYLDAVVKETFRVHPPVPLLLQRCPDESCTVGGYTIPKGSVVFMNIWMIHRDPKIWIDPLEFNPDRFLTGQWDYSGNNFKFLPFGSGRRICPGVSLGEKMLMYILASLLHSFEWSLPKDEEFELSDEFGMLTKKRTPLKAIATQRLWDESLYL